MKHPLLAILLLPLVLSACDEFTQVPFDGRKALDKMDGPTIPTVNGSINANAERALKSGDIRLAGQLYKQLLDSDKDNPEYLMGMAESLRRAGAYDEAIKIYDNLIGKDAKNLGALEGKGLCLLAKGEFVDAGKQFSRVMDIDSKRWRTLNAIGILFTTRTMVDEATAYYDEALRYSPDNISVLNNKGLSIAIDRQFDKSLSMLERASKLANADSEERKRIDLNRALVYGIKGDLNAAEAIAGKHLTGPSLYNNMGIYAHLAKDDVMAKSYLNMALSNSPVFYERAWDNLDDVNQGSKPKKSGGGKTYKVLEDPVKPIALPEKPKDSSGEGDKKPAKDGKDDSKKAEPKPEDKPLKKLTE